MSGPLAGLRGQLDAQVVGHDDVKRALLLALVCREHVYLEGPPGTAKTRMAEVLARGSSLRFFFHQLHRDTRLADLMGDVVLERTPLADGSGERLHQRLEAGGILTAEVCVLDDFSRAPGEALNVLLRVLNERKYGADAIPLRCVIATNNPVGDAYAHDPVDPAQLDRFALQLRVQGLIASGAPELVQNVLQRFSQPGFLDAPEPEPVLDRESLDALYARLARVELGPEIRAALLRVLQVLVNELGCDETNSLLTDRTFLVKGLKLLRGMAVLAGRERVIADDLSVLSWMARFRVPPDVYEKLPDVIARERP